MALSAEAALAQIRLAVSDIETLSGEVGAVPSETLVRQRYRERFGSFPPVAHVRGVPDEVLNSLMQRALQTGEEVTAKTLADVLGAELPPQGALT